MTGGAVSGRADCSASQMGQDQISFKIPCSGKDSAGSTRLCIVHVAVGKPLRPKSWLSSIIFEVPPGFEVLALYARIALRLRTLSKRKLGRSFFFGWRSGPTPKNHVCLRVPSHPPKLMVLWTPGRRPLRTAEYGTVKGLAVRPASETVECLSRKPRRCRMRHTRFALSAVPEWCEIALVGRLSAATLATRSAIPPTPSQMTTHTPPQPHTVAMDPRTPGWGKPIDRCGQTPMVANDLQQI